MVHNGRAIRRRDRGHDLAEASRETVRPREARLTADSGDRAGGGGPRVLVFVTAGLILGLEVTAMDDGRGLRVDGFLTPAPDEPTRVRTRGSGRRPRATTDAEGRFTLRAVAPGPFSILLRPDPDGFPVVTEWLVL